MTLQIRKNDRISGIPLKEVRRFFRHIASWHEASFDLNRLREKLSLTEESSRALAMELVHQGYVESPENAAYRLTEKGRDLIRASAAGRITRKTAENALAGLLERAEKYNCDQNRPLAIEAIVIFGSFLGTKDRLGDLDVAVKYRYRDSSQDHGRRSVDYAMQSGRHFASFVDMLAWPQTELRQILKARKRTIRIQDWDEFRQLSRSGKGVLQYKVVFGKSADVEKEICGLTNNSNAT